MHNWVIYGGGGHARVIADAIKLNRGLVNTYFDDNKEILSIENIRVLPYHESVDLEARMIIGIGNNEVRRNISKYIVHEFGILIHPSAVVADDVKIGEGSIVLAGAVIQTGAIIGKHVIINANVTVDHDVVIGDFCCIYPNSYIGGGAVIGAGNNIAACTVIARQTKMACTFEANDIVELDLY